VFYEKEEGENTDAMRLSSTSGNEATAEEVAIDALKRKCNGYNIPSTLDCEEVIRLIKEAGVNFIFANPSSKKNNCTHADGSNETKRGDKTQ